MIEIICQGNSPSEARAKCMITKTLLTLLTEEKISTDKTINVLNAIGGVYITETEGKE